MPDPVDTPTIEVPDDIADVIGEEGDTGVVNFSVDLGAEEGEGPPSESIILIIGLTLLSVAPSLVIMLTSFTRIVIVFCWFAVRSVSRASRRTRWIGPLFLSLFIMGPTLDQMNEVGPSRISMVRRPNPRRTTPPSLRCASSCSPIPATTSSS